MHLNFSTETPEQKLRIGRVIRKVLPVVQRILPVAATFIPALAPVAAISAAIGSR